MIWWLWKTNETNNFRIKNLGVFNLTILKVNKFTMIECKFTIDFLPKSKATFCKTYSHDHMQFQFHGLFYLNLLNTNTHVCDFEIPFKGFRPQSVVNLYAATCFHQFLIVDLVPVDACWVRRLQKPHRSHKSNSQDFQRLLKCN